MATELSVQRFDLKRSPWLQRAANERFRNVWAYWLDVVEPFRLEKEDVERRVAHVLEQNRQEDLLVFAANDRDLRHGFAGPPRSVVDPDPVRVAAFRLVELATLEALEELYLASLAPAAESDLVCEQTPGLWECLSQRDHLLPITEETLPQEARGNVPYFVIRDRAIYPHPFIWPNRELMGDVIDLGVSGFDAKIAIDPVRATSREDAVDEMLLDYWFGCRLRRETIDSLDVRHLGETWHMRPSGRATISSRPLAATVFRWSADGYIKKLEVVELAPRDARSLQPGPYVVNRYLHSLRDTVQKRFTHVDGAVRAYDAKTYGPSQSAPKAPTGDAVRYRKLFRVDGALDDERWGRIVAHFFRGNELVIEYFGDPLDERGWSGPSDEAPPHTVSVAP